MTFPSMRLALACGLVLFFGPAGCTDAAEESAEAAAGPVTQASASPASPTASRGDVAPVDVCALLDTDALVGMMEAAGGEQVKVVSEDVLLGSCEFIDYSSNRMRVAVTATDLTVDEIMPPFREPRDAPEVGDGVKSVQNPNNRDQRSFAFTARGTTFDIITTFKNEADATAFASRVLSMVRGSS